MEHLYCSKYFVPGKYTYVSLEGKHCRLSKIWEAESNYTHIGLKKSSLFFSAYNVFNIKNINNF